MTLTSAISILARVHTRPRPYGIGADDPRTFEVIVGAEDRPYENGVSHAEYIEAWSVMRENAGLMPEARPQDDLEFLRRTLRSIKEMTPSTYAREHAIIDHALRGGGRQVKQTQAELDLEVAERAAEFAEKELHDAEEHVRYWASEFQRAEKARIEAQFKVRAEKLG